MTVAMWTTRMTTFMTDQLRECPFCNGDGELDIDENHNHFVSCIECRAEGSRAACASDAANAWNTRPTAVASHAEAFTYGHCAEKSRPGGCQKHNLQCGYPDCDRRPVAHPHRTTDNLNEPSGDSGELARDAARYRWLRDRGWFTNNYGEFEAGDDETAEHVSVMLDKAIDAAMAAGGGSDE
jgi:hypothetical protein